MRCDAANPPKPCSTQLEDDIIHRAPQIRRGTALEDTQERRRAVRSDGKKWDDREVGGGFPYDRPDGCRGHQAHEALSRFGDQSLLKHDSLQKKPTEV